LPTNAPPKRTPSSRLKSSLTITMRASISTCLTGMSRVDTRRRMSARRSAVSCSRSVLVRSSIEMLPRSDSSELLPCDLISDARSEALA
jgi:hypothetical protein